MERLQRELFEAAASGSVSSLQQLLIYDPLLLDRVTPNYNSETALHVSALLGHLDFVKQIIGIKPELTHELNSQGSSPLHLASAKGHVNVVRELLSVFVVGHETTCLARDKDGLTPLHLAAIKGRVEVMKLLLQAKPDAARLKTLYGDETILHLCVKNWQVEALKLLVSSVGDPEFVKAIDGEGNTLLHLAVEYKQLETVKFLVSVGVDVNALNNERMTALDVLIGSRRDMRDSEIEKSLKHGGGYRSATLETNNNNTKTRRRVDKKDKEESWESSVKKHEDWLEKTKSGLMVVASLIATMAFQIGVNPPGGVWQDDKLLNDKLPNDKLPNDKLLNPRNITMEAGSSIFAHKFPFGYELFYTINTVAFMASLSIILLLMSGFRMRRRFLMWILVLTTWIAISAIALSYIFAAFVLTPGDKYNSIVRVVGFTFIMWLLLMALLLITHTIHLIIMLVKKIKNLFSRWGGSRSLV